MKILHLSYDYPDKIKSNKTVAIKNLINANNDKCENLCISLNRIVKRSEEKVYYDNDVISVSNFGLPKGIFFRYTLKHSYDIVKNLNINYDEIDIIHAHKLTFEGYIAYELYKSKAIPYIITLRHTDQVILKCRKDLMKYYKEVLLNARKIIIISPWMMQVFRDILGNEFFNSIEDKIQNIANIMDVKNKIMLEEDNGKFISVFHLKNEEIKRKNIDNVLKAISLLRKKGIEIKLDIIGDGVARQKIEKKIAKLGLENNVKCLGARKNNEIINIISKYKGFILCSYPETFGMVFIEAICAGVPIISAKNTGIDGFFKNDIGVYVDHLSINEIANGISKVNSNTKLYKDNIKFVQESNILETLFSKDEISNRYYKIIEDIYNSINISNEDCV